MLQNQSLLRTEAFIGGKWAKGQKTFAVHNPSTGAKIADVADLGAAETRAAIESAGKAQKLWQEKPAKDRAAIMRKWFELILKNQDDLAKLMTMEQGKPLAEAKGEIVYAASFVEWYAEEAKRVYGDTIPAPKSSQRIVVLKQPVGVVAAITPWNFPAAMITRKCAPALAAGCAVVLKPAEQTPLSALALAHLAVEAGFPEGVFNIVTGSDPESIGTELTSHPTVKKIGFTGSTEVGRILMRQAAGTVKKISLELGGNAPFIVFADADLDAAVTGAINSKFRNAGQTCVCANRIFVERAIYPQFSAKLAEAMKKLKLADGFEDGAQIGPLIDKAAIEKVESLIADAKQQGAKIVMGGKVAKQGGQFFEPTLIENASVKMRLSSEEIFGPVAALYPFDGEEEAVKLANDTIYGLAAYFYSRDLARVFRVAEKLEYGMVGVNEGLISTEVAPFGGIKQSGFGREGSYYGIEEYVQTKYLLLGGIQ